VWILVATGAVVLLAAIAVTTALIPAAVATPSAGAATHGPLRVEAITPDASWIPPDAPIRIDFNNPIAAASPMPTITPHVRGSWVMLAPDELSFQADAPMSPGQAYEISIPATTRTTAGTTLRHTVLRRFAISMGSTLRLDQLLAELNYLPLRFVPTGPFDPTSTAVQRGTFAWRWSSVPTQLTALWQPSTFNVITKGALMRFEDANNLASAGVATPQVWDALISAVAGGNVNKIPYAYVDVSTDLPETLTLYVNMHPIYSTPVNTGISSRPTGLATNPVYVRYTSTTMSGTNPDGSHYSDPGIPWVSYFSGGEALHGFIRSSYGWPQSLGCVEMPFANAAIVWPYTPIGTLVTVH
jgi:lipoprotein-anchoring transpeptidase ErfK/SrfK